MHDDPINDPLAAAIARASPEQLERARERIEEVAAAKRTFFRNALIALDFNGISGDYAEFGCYGGQTMQLAHEAIQLGETQRHMWAFDSFAGLPGRAHERDDHPAWNAATMAMDERQFGRIMESEGIAESAYTTVPGFYADSLPALGDGEPTDIALAYIDCDMYSSTVSVLEFLEPRLKHGMILGFDDYFCWSASSVSGERLALMELSERMPRFNFERYRDFDFGGSSFVVEDREMLPSSLR